jgi:peptide/nickel transport system permease protein
VKAFGWLRSGGPVVVGSAALLGILGLTAVLAPVVAPYDYRQQNRQFPNCPPSPLRVRAPADWGESIFYTHPYRLADPTTRRYELITETIVPIHLFTNGHLFTTKPDTGKFFALGTDGLGRDLFSRIVFGGRVSLAVGLIGVAITCALGTALGTVAGYFGGWVDSIIMRAVEVQMSLPTFYLLLALAAVIPADVGPAARFVLIVAIMSCAGWAGFARVIRGLVASLRGVEYVTAARALGVPRWLILTRHIIPATFGYTIVAATLGVPSFILRESALSLLGLGIQEPGASWGNLLSEAQNVQNLVRYPWILAPGLCIVVTVMCSNFLGDHLRDRLDPRTQW